MDRSRIGPACSLFKYYLLQNYARSVTTDCIVLSIKSRFWDCSIFSSVQQFQSWPSCFFYICTPHPYSPTIPPPPPIVCQLWYIASTSFKSSARWFGDGDSPKATLPFSSQATTHSLSCRSWRLSSWPLSFLERWSWLLSQKYPSSQPTSQ